MAYQVPDEASCAVCGWLADRADGMIVVTEYSALAIAERQRVRGAVVAFPRTHVNSPAQMSMAATNDLWQLVRAASIAIEELYNPDGMHTWEDIGTLADASFAHLTIDIVPRFTADTYKFAKYASLPVIDAATRRSEASRIAAEIAAHRS